MTETALHIVLLLDTISFAIAMYLIFVKPFLDKQRINRKRPYNGLYLEIEFYDIGIRTGSIPPINISDAFNNGTSFLLDTLKKYTGWKL